LTLITAVGLAAGCSRPEPTDPADAAFGELREALYAADTRSEVVQLAEGFIGDFPNSRYTGLLAQDIAAYHGKEMGNHDHVYQVLHGALQVIQDPEVRFEVSLALLPSARAVGQPLDAEQIVADLAAERELKFTDHLTVMVAAEEAEEWPMAEKHADAALAFATEEAYRAEYPDLEMEDDEVAERANRRRATSLAYKGWALFRQGWTEDGIAALDEAEEITDADYLGVATTPLDLFRGRALLAQGEFEQALEMLAPDAIFGFSQTTTVALLREAYAAHNGGGDGFEEYLWATRTRLAKHVDDFTLPDYDDTAHTLSDRNGRVVLLAFWFPT
jgi:hypothetical protein